MHSYNKECMENGKVEFFEVSSLHESIQYTPVTIGAQKICSVSYIYFSGCFPPGFVSSFIT
jgi:hypothetical protein